MKPRKRCAIDIGHSLLEFRRYAAHGILLCESNSAVFPDVHSRRRPVLHRKSRFSLEVLLISFVV